MVPELLRYHCCGSSLRGSALTFSWFLFHTLRRENLIGLAWVCAHPWAHDKFKAARIHILWKYGMQCGDVTPEKGGSLWGDLLIPKDSYCSVDCLWCLWFFFFSNGAGLYCFLKISLWLQCFITKALFLFCAFACANRSSHSLPSSPGWPPFMFKFQIKWLFRRTHQ